MSGIEKNDFFKSLERLETLAQGSEDVNKSQICTGSGNEPQTWPGGDKDQFGDNWDDNIAEDGTDYNARSKRTRKSIAEKVMKGAALSDSEIAILKGDYIGKSADKDMDDKFGDKDKDEDDDDKKMRGKGDDEDEGGALAGLFGGGGPNAKKSFEGAIRENETLNKGIEVSDFLLEMTRAIGAGLQGVEARVTENVTKSVLGALGHINNEQGEFNKSLADAVVNIGHGLAGFMTQVEQAGESPAGPPRSQMRAIPGGAQGVQVMNKGMDDQNPLSRMEKSQVLDFMTDLVEKGQCSPLDVVKFETTGEMSPNAQSALRKSIGAGQ